MIHGIIVQNKDNKVKGQCSASDLESVNASTPDECTFYQDVHIDNNRLKYAFFDGSKVTYTKTTAENLNETQWRTLRAHRNELLLGSDWTQANDAPLTDAKKQAWREYREALRNLPSNTSDPSKVVFPKSPS